MVAVDIRISVLVFWQSESESDQVWYSERENGFASERVGMSSIVSSDFIFCMLVLV